MVEKRSRRWQMRRRLGSGGRSAGARVRRAIRRGRRPDVGPARRTPPPSARAARLLRRRRRRRVRAPRGSVRMPLTPRRLRRRPLGGPAARAARRPPACRRGGMSLSDLLAACRHTAAGLDLVGADVVEVIPTAIGSADTTALAAERIVREILTGIALRRGHQSGQATLKKSQAAAWPGQWPLRRRRRRRRRRSLSGHSGRLCPHVCRRREDHSFTMRGGVSAKTPGDSPTDEPRASESPTRRRPLTQGEAKAQPRARVTPVGRPRQSSRRGKPGRLLAHGSGSAGRFRELSFSDVLVKAAPACLSHPSGSGRLAGSHARSSPNASMATAQQACSLLHACGCRLRTAVSARYPATPLRADGADRSHHELSLA